MARPIHAASAASAALLALSLGACGTNPFTTASWSTRHSLSERECLARAMYFESNRSSGDGMTAVGTVVMNRLQSGRYPKTVCGVVGQRNQFADGALSKPVSGRSWALALDRADAVLGGERHAQVGGAMHFHTAGYTFPYRNMAYVVAAGGNVFYEKQTPGTFTPVNPSVLVAQAERPRARPSEPILVTEAEPPAPRFERTRMAQLEEREAPRAMRTVVERPISQRLREDIRPQPEPARTARVEDRRDRGAARIRLAHLEDGALPPGVRARSDAGPGPGMMLPTRPMPAGRPSAAGPKASMSPVPLPVPRHEPVRAGAAPAPRIAGLNPGLRPSTARPDPAPPPITGRMGGSGRMEGKPLAYSPPPRVAPAAVATHRPMPPNVSTTKTAAPDPAKLGWKKGSDPVNRPAAEPPRKRS